jgi:hypothetical protein
MDPANAEKSVLIPGFAFTGVFDPVEQREQQEFGLFLRLGLGTVSLTRGPTDVFANGQKRANKCRLCYC